MVSAGMLHDVPGPIDRVFNEDASGRAGVSDVMFPADVSGSA